MPNVRGRAIAVRCQFVRERFGAQGWAEVERRLPPAVRETLAAPLDPSGWYPMVLYDALQRAIGEAHGQSGGALYEEMGAFSAEHNAAALFGAPGRDPFDFFKHVAELHSQMFDFGDMTVVRRPGGCMIEVDYVGHASELVCRSAVGFYRRCAEMNGARNVQVEVLGCQARSDSTCLFKVTWRRIRRTINAPPTAKSS